MFKTAKNIAEYFYYLLPHRKTKWGLCIGLLPIIILWVLYISPLFWSNRYEFLIKSGVCLSISFLITLLWLFHSRRIILRNKNLTVALSLTANSLKSNEYVQNTISILQDELDRLGLLNRVRLLLAGQDIIPNIEKAHKYRQNFDLDLIIWGEVFCGKKEEKEVCDFKRLFFTYKIPHQIVVKNFTDLFKTDINIALINRDWNVYELNSLPDIEKITGHLMEVIMFILGIIYCQAKEYAEDSIVILERLFAILDQKSKDEQITLSPDNKTFTMSTNAFRKGRVLAILLNVYKNLGIYFCEKQQYEKARFYFEKYQKYEKKNTDVLSGLALCSFFLDDYKAAKQYTEEIGKIDKYNQIYIINRAFFGILEKNYSSALHFYKEFIKRGRILTKDVVIKVLAFLDERKTQNTEEIAYDFAIGLLEYYFIQKKTGEKDLRKFVKLGQNKPEYKEMVDFIQQNIFKKSKKKKH